MFNLTKAHNMCFCTLCAMRFKTSREFESNSSHMSFIRRVYVIKNKRKIPFVDGQSVCKFWCSPAWAVQFLVSGSRVHVPTRPAFLVRLHISTESNK